MKKNALNLFLSQKRFDLIFKYLYVKNFNNFNKQAYLENIRAFNNFYESHPSDKIPKNSPEDFINSFNRLIEHINKDLFQEKYGRIPIGNNGEITDGAHRLSVCAAKNISILTEHSERSDLYDYKFFKKQEMDESIMDYGALEYVKLNPNAYIVNLHSTSDIKKDYLVENILNKYGFIYYKKNINITFNGYVNLKKLSYGNFGEKTSWIGNVQNKFAGAQAHAKYSMGKNPLRVYVFVCQDFDSVVKAKAEIRDLFDLGNYSVHINDSKEEAIRLAQIYFNKNSLLMINERPFCFEDIRFDTYIEKLKTFCSENNLDIERFCLAGSTPLNIVGARQSSDMDFLCLDNDLDLNEKLLSNHEKELKYYPYDKETIITNPNYYFYYKGVKVISLETLYLMKKNRNEYPKDVKDCKKIKAILKHNPFLNFSIPPLIKKIKIGNKRKLIILGLIKISYKKNKTTN